MKSKMRLFKYTFIVLSIMCCLLLGSTSVIYAFSELNSNSVFNANNTQSPVTAAESISPSDTSASTTSKTESISDTSAEDNNSSDSPGQVTIIEDQTIPPEDIIPASITISAVGDLMAHQGNLNNAYTPKTGRYNFDGFLEYVKPYLIESDLTIGNFETVTAGPSSGYTSYPTFNTPDAMLTALAGAGFDVLSTANNHCLDRGINGLTRTIQKIGTSKMTNVGSSIDGKNKYTTKEINGIKVSILSYTSTFNGNDARLKSSQKAKYLSPMNEAQIQSDIKAVKAKGTDAVIVIIHWGDEYQREPNVTQISLSKKILLWELI